MPMPNDADYIEDGLDLDSRSSARVFTMRLYRYAQVVRYQTYAGLKAEVARTYIGVLWWVFEPILSALALYVVFGLVLGRKENGFLLFLLVGTFSWQWFAGSVMLAASSILSKAGVLQQVYLPKAVFSLIAVLTGTWKFLCTGLVLLGALLIGGKLPGLAYLALPIVMAVQFLLNLAVGLPLSIWIPYFRDGTTVIGSLMGLFSLASGLFFRIDQVPPPYDVLVQWNPMAQLIVSYRSILLDNSFPDWRPLAVIFAGSILLLVFGATLAQRYDLKLAKAAV